MKVEREPYTLYILTHEEVEQIVREKEGDLTDVIDEYSEIVNWAADILGGELEYYHEDFVVIKVYKLDTKRYEPLLRETISTDGIKVTTKPLLYVTSLYRGTHERGVYINPENQDIFIIAPRKDEVIIEYYMKNETYRFYKLKYLPGKDKFELELY